MRRQAELGSILCMAEQDSLRMGVCLHDTLHATQGCQVQVLWVAAACVCEPSFFLTIASWNCLMELLDGIA